MKTIKSMRRQSPVFILVAAVAAIILAGCADSRVDNPSAVNPLAAYQPDSGKSGLPTNGQTQGVGKIDNPIVNIPYPTDGRKDHTNAPLLDNFHPGWQQDNCFGCHTDQSRIPDHSYPDTTNCYLCHGTNGLPGFGDATPPVIRGIVAAPTGDSVTVSWPTDEPSMTRLILKTKEGDRMEFPVSVDYNINHRYTVNGLLRSTTYTYEIVAMDKNSNKSTTTTIGVLSFTTLATPTVTTGTGQPAQTSYFGPITIVVKDSYSATVEWTTKFPSKDILKLENLDEGTMRRIDVGGPQSYFKGELSPLISSTSYRLSIEATDQDTSKLYTSEKKKFFTPPPN